MAASAQRAGRSTSQGGGGKEGRARGRGRPTVRGPLERQLVRHVRRHPACAGTPSCAARCSSRGAPRDQRPINARREQLDEQKRKRMTRDNAVEWSSVTGSRHATAVKTREAKPLSSWSVVCSKRGVCVPAGFLPCNCRVDISMARCARTHRWFGRFPCHAFSSGACSRIFPDWMLRFVNFRPCMCTHNVPPCMQLFEGGEDTEGGKEGEIRTARVAAFSVA